MLWWTLLAIPVSVPGLVAPLAGGGALGGDVVAGATDVAPPPAPVVFSIGTLNTIGSIFGTIPP